MHGSVTQKESEIEKVLSIKQFLRYDLLFINFGLYRWEEFSFFFLRLLPNNQGVQALDFLLLRNFKFLWLRGIFCEGFKEKSSNLQISIQICDYLRQNCVFFQKF